MSQYSEKERKKLYSILCQRSSAFIKEADTPPVPIEMEILISEPNAVVQKRYEVKTIDVFDFCREKNQEIVDLLSPMFRSRDPNRFRNYSSYKVEITVRYYSKGKCLKTVNPFSGKICDHIFIIVNPVPERDEEAVERVRKVLEENL
jgi:hypothetical protein